MTLPAVIPGKYLQGQDANGNPVQKRVSITEIDTTPIFGAEATSGTENTVAYGTLTFTLDDEALNFKTNYVIQGWPQTGPYIDDPDVCFWGIITEKNTDAEPAQMKVAVFAISDLVGTYTNWRFKVIQGPIPTADAALIGVSSTSRTLAPGTHTFTTQSGKFFPIGGSVLVTALGDETKRMWGVVVAYSGTSLKISVAGNGVFGSGSASSWFIYLVDGAPRGLRMDEIQGLEVIRRAAVPETQISISSGAVRDSTNTVDLVFDGHDHLDLSLSFGFGNGIQVLSAVQSGSVSSSGLSVTGTSTAFNTVYKTARFSASPDFILLGDAIINSNGVISLVTSVENDTSLATFSELSASSDSHRRGGWITTEPFVWYGISVIRRDSDGEVSICASSFTPTGVPDLPSGYTYYRQLCAVQVSAGVIQRITHLWYGDDEDIRYPYSILPNPEFRVPQSVTSYPDIADGTEGFSGWYVLSDGDGIVDFTRGVVATYNSGLLRVQIANKRFGVFAPLSYADARTIVGLTAVNSDNLCSLSFLAQSVSGVSNIRAAIVEWTGTADAYEVDIVDSWGSSGDDPTLKTGWNYALTTGDVPLSGFTDIALESVEINANAKNIGVFIWVDDDDLSVNDALQLLVVNLVPGAVATPYRARVTELDAAACGLYKNSEFIDYDNATSGLTATNVQDAIDEVAAAAADDAVDSVFGRTGAVVAAASDYDADQIDYDNAASGLTATDVQAAIDEVADALASGGMTDEQRRNAALDSIYLSKSLGYSRRLINAFADGYEGTDGINAGASSNYTAAGDGKVSPSTTADTWSTAVDPAPNANFANTTLVAIRQRIAAAALANLSGDAIRVTFAPTTAGDNTVILNAFVGHMGASAPDFDGNQVRLTFGGGNNGTTLTAGGSAVVSDTIAFAGYDETQDLIVEFECTAASDLRRNISTTADYTVYARTSNADIGVTDVNVADYSVGTSDVYVVDLVEIRTVTGTTNNMTLVTTSQTADASVDTARALIEVDENESITVNTDLTVELTCNGGTNWATATLSEIGTGQDGRTVYETAATACTAGTSFAARIKTLNNKNVDLHGTRIAVSA